MKQPHLEKSTEMNSWKAREVLKHDQAKTTRPLTVDRKKTGSSSRQEELTGITSKDLVSFRR